MEAVLPIKLILYFATNCPQRVVRDELSCDELSTTICLRQFLRQRIVQEPAKIGKTDFKILQFFKSAVACEFVRICKVVTQF